ncbi:MAG: hypothetical protein IJ121_03235 [Eubacterium sp.]|nr:hypothetical protein [Eubacterium sp.]
MNHVNQKMMPEKRFAAFLMPIMASAVFQQCYALINAGILGRIRSEEAVAVIGSCAFLGTLQHFIFNGMTTGFGIVQCRFFEELQPEGRAEAVSRQAGGSSVSEPADRSSAEGYRISFWCGIYLTVLLAVAAWLAVPAVGPILSALNVPVKLRAEAAGYAAWIIAGSGFSALRNFLVWTVQGMKKTGVSGAVTAASVVTQTALTVFLTGVLRLPVWSAAAAVFLNHVLICLLLSIYLAVTAGKDLALCRPYRIPRRMYREMMRGGLSKSAMMAMVAFAGILRQRMVNSFSVNEIAGYTYASAISNVFQVIVGAYGTAAAILCGRWYGAGRFQLLKAEFRRLLLHSVFAALLCSAGAFFFAENLVMAAAGAGAVAEVVIQSGSAYLAVSQWGLTGLAFYLTGRYTLQSIGSNASQLVLGAIEALSGILLLQTIVAKTGFPAMGWYPVVTWGLSGMSALIMLHFRYRIIDRNCVLRGIR